MGGHLNPLGWRWFSRVDQKTQIQSLDRTQLMLSMRPGVPMCHTTEYRCHGVAAMDSAGDGTLGVC